jgi:hypothetical protein
MKMTRREIALGIAALAGLPAGAQNTQVTAPDWDRLARDAHMESAQAIATVELPMLTEPAFQFKA